MTLQEKKELGLELYKSGKSLTKISEELGISRSTLTKFVKSEGLEIINSSKKYHYNENYFNIIDTEFKAYWLGFIYADGCVSIRKGKSGNIKSKLLEVTLKEEDSSHLYKLLNQINGDEEMIKSKTIKLKGKEYKAKRICVSSTKLCDDLIKHKCFPNKSLILRFPDNLPSNLIRHFMRGYFDGDGHISKSRTRIVLVGTKEFLDKYIEIVNFTPTKYSMTGNAYQFDKAGNEVIEFLTLIYKDSNVYLDRKYSRYCRLTIM